MIVKGYSEKPDVIAGIVSFGGLECNDKPAVFTRVSAYKVWLEGNLCRGSPSIIPPYWCSKNDSRPKKPPTKKKGNDRPRPTGVRSTGPMKPR
jgi:secreted trypsin-like serine protease